MKKLIPAIALLLVSAITLSTASYAWFSMNKTVKATDMQVTAKSNATYLLIGDATDVGTTAETLQAEALTTAAAHNTGASQQFYPADYTTSPISDTVVANKWYTCNNGVTSAATGSETNYKVVTEGDNNYMLYNKFCLVLTADSEEWSGALKITYTETDNIGCVATMIKVNDTYYRFDTNNNITINNIGISATQVISVEVFTFIDGKTTNVYTDYEEKSALTGSIDLTFDLVDNVDDET